MAKSEKVLLYFVKGCRWAKTLKCHNFLISVLKVSYSPNLPFCFKVCIIGKRQVEIVFASTLADSFYVEV